MARDFKKGEDRLDTAIRVLKSTREDLREFQEAFEKKNLTKITDDLFVRKALKMMWESELGVKK